VTAPNHALTGAFIGLSISNPVLALPLALVSHLVCDFIPHYDQPEPLALDRIKSRRFIYEQIVTGAVLCFLLVVVLAVTQPRHWLLAAVCAFAAASPDLLWIPRFVHIKRTGQDITLRGWFWFHDSLALTTGPRYIWLELAWFVAFGALVARML